MKYTLPNRFDIDMMSRHCFLIKDHDSVNQYYTQYMGITPTHPTMDVQHAPFLYSTTRSTYVQLRPLHTHPPMTNHMPQFDTHHTNI